jgi:hypothetical protein
LLDVPPTPGTAEILGRSGPMHGDIRTSWIGWITALGYVAMCGMLWAGK